MGVKESLFRLPNGETSKDSELYIAVWREAAKPIMAFTGLNLTGYDPNFHFQDRWGIRRLVLPAWFVLAIGPHLPSKCTDFAFLELLEQREQWEEKRKEIMQTWV